MEYDKFSSDINLLPLNSIFMTVNAVIDSTGVIDDDRLVNLFVKNISLKVPSRIIVERYTLEGESTFRIIKYDGDKITYIEDFSKTYSNYINTFYGDRIKIDKDTYSITYNLYSGDNFITKMFAYHAKNKE